jgi:CBS domain-containing protein
VFVERILPIALQRLITIPDDALLTDAAKLLSSAHISLVVVCNPDGVMVGVITKTDIVRQIAHCHGLSCTMSAAAAMTRTLTYCHPSDALQDVLSIIKEHGFVHIPIVEQDFRPVGVVNARDALQALLVEADDEGLLLRDYIMGIGYH